MLDSLLELIFEFLTELLFQLLVEIGFELIAEFFRRHQTLSAVFAYFAIGLSGAFAGLFASTMFPQRILSISIIPGISLLVTPVVAGWIMKSFGDWRLSRGHQPTILATFWGGALCAFMMALVRWIRVG